MYSSHTKLIVLLLFRWSQKLTNAYMRLQSMSATKTKRMYVSLIHTDSFYQMRICVHSAQRLNCISSLCSFCRCLLSFLRCAEHSYLSQLMATCIISLPYTQSLSGYCLLSRSAAMFSRPGQCSIMMS